MTGGGLRGLDLSDEQVEKTAELKQNCFKKFSPPKSTTWSCMLNWLKSWATPASIKPKYRPLLKK